MDSFYLSCNVVLPLFFTLSLGYFLIRRNFLNENILNELNVLIFKVFYPIFIFYNIYSNSSSSGIDFKIIGFGAITLVLFFLLVFLIVPIFEKENKRKSVIIQGMVRSNSLLFALPISNSLFGQEYAYVTSVVVGFMIAVVNILSVIILEIYKDDKIDYKKIIMGVFKNPLIQAIIVGFIFVLLNIKLPSVLTASIKSVSGVATPLALITLGGFFKFKDSYANIKALLWTCFGKLILMPVLFLPVAYLFNFDKVSMGILASIYCSPTATSSFTMAKQEGADYKLAGQIVAITSAFSIITIFLTIFILKSLNLI